MSASGVRLTMETAILNALFPAVIGMEMIVLLIGTEKKKKHQKRKKQLKKLQQLKKQHLQMRQLLQMKQFQLMRRQKKQLQLDPFISTPH